MRVSLFLMRKGRGRGGQGKTELQFRTGTLGGAVFCSGFGSVFLLVGLVLGV